jgi:hypothetical protein
MEEDMAEGPDTIEGQESEWSDDEARLIHHGKLIARLLRESERPGKADQPKPSWQRFLESSGGTALVTVIIGGLFGTLISALVQYGASGREFQQAWLKGRGDQALVAYKDFLDKQQEIIKRVYDRLGTCISASEDLASLSKDVNQTKNYEGDQKTRVMKYRISVQDKYTQSEAEWRSERDALGLLMDYYHPRQTNVIAAWRDLKESMTKYMSCVEKWSHDNPLSAETEDACKPEKDALVNRIDHLTSSLEINRTYAWDGWESPEKLKDALAK